MGMAASQARFLQLTARRTNIEYMGQQINQQRLALANQSAGLFERMLTLEPPVPPSSLDDKYYTQGYRFTDPIDEMDKKISWVQMDDTSVPATTDLTVTSTYYSNGVPSLEAGDVDWINNGTTDATVAPPAAVDGGVLTTDTYNVTSAELFATYCDDESDVGTDADLEALMTSIGVTPQDDTVRSVMRFVTVENTAYDPDGNYITVQRQTPAILEFDNLERLINIVFLDDMELTGTGGDEGTAATVTGGVAGTGALAGNTYSEADTIVAGTNGSAPASLADLSALSGSVGTEIITESGETVLVNDDGEVATMNYGESLTYSGVFDEVSYNDDMNKYEFAKSAYDYQIERINMETAQIQKQDKSLELKMKQLDTEHNAVQTEMEAVQKVIQKNIEGSFKTFA